MNNGFTKQKIGILGGTFNPIHLGHLIMAEQAREFAGLDKVLFMPTGVSYMKNAKEIQSAYHRATMIQKSIQENPFFELSYVELNKSGNTYTCETLIELHQIYPDTEFYFIVGADCLFTIQNWYHPQEIFDNCILLVATRNHVTLEKMTEKKEYLEREFHGKILLMPMNDIEISSSDIRSRLLQNKTVRYLMHEEVHAYIQDNNLYKDN